MRLNEREFSNVDFQDQHVIFTNMYIYIIIQLRYVLVGKSYTGLRLACISMCPPSNEESQLTFHFKREQEFCYFSNDFSDG